MENIITTFSGNCCVLTVNESFEYNLENDEFYLGINLVNVPGTYTPKNYNPEYETIYSRSCWITEFILIIFSMVLRIK